MDIWRYRAEEDGSAWRDKYVSTFENLYMLRNNATISNDDIWIEHLTNYLAGDFNAGLEWDKRQGNNSHRIMFERIEDFGLIDVLKTSGPVQTWRCSKSKVKWQNDYMFISKGLYDRVKSAKVLCTPEIEKLSDHNPIELILAPAPSGSG
jgi:endonuclease/exonuclease/phosphatase family metal-dependent hydrolase